MLVRAFLGHMAPLLDHVKPGELHDPCSAGSRWHTFAFTEDDENRILTVEGLRGLSAGQLGYRYMVDGEARTEQIFEGVAANYTTLTTGRCMGLLERITTVEECGAAAVALG